MIEDIVFIICCKESDFIENCINHLDNNYPNNYKIIIDSDSTDKSYMNKIKKDKVIIEDKEYPTDVVSSPNRITKLDCYGTNLESWALNHKKKFIY